MASESSPNGSSSRRQFSPLWLFALFPLVSLLIALFTLLGSSDSENESDNRAGSFPSPLPVTFIPPTRLPTLPPTILPAEFSVLEQPVPDMAVTSLQGETIRFRAFEGQIIFLNFWATWCEPCREEMPELQALRDNHGANGVYVIGVTDPAYGQTEADVRAFVEQYQITFAVALSSDADFYSRFGVAALPLTFIIDRAGIVRYRHIGALTAEDIRVYLDWLGEPVGSR